MKSSPDRRKIVVQAWESYGTELYDFDPNTGVVSNCQVLNSGSTRQYGAEFSPDNTKLYTINETSPSIHQYDISLPTTSAIIASKTLITSGSSPVTDFKIGPDHKIYFGSLTSSGFLSCITNPNLAGTSCGLVSNVVALNTGTNRTLGLSNNVTFVYPNDTSYARHDTVVCLPTGSAITIIAHDSLIGSYCLWDDGVTTINTRTVSSPGTYWVKIYNGCGLKIDTIHVTSYSLVGAIAGTTGICTGSTTVLTDTSAGGTWSSSNPAIATIGSSSGIVTGISAGIDTITYTMPTGCYVTKSVTVHPLPAAISGASTVCAGTSIVLSNSSPGGTWSSSSTSIASVGSGTGIVTGIMTGTTTITYTLPTGCYNTFINTVHPLPSSITGSAIVCAGATTSLSSITTGGIWSSSSPSVAIVGSTTGVVTGVANGLATINYTLPTGCFLSRLVTINSLPSYVGGVSTLCATGVASLVGLPGGGTWVSSTPSIATVGSVSGSVTGVSSGTATITYSLPTGCSATTLITINPAPVAITGSPVICIGYPDTFSYTIPGGYWTSSNMAVADVNVSTGLVTGVSSGTAIITYNLGASCNAIQPVTVSLSPTSITGFMSACAGATAPLYNGVLGGTWSSSATGIATINPLTGAYTGVLAGTATISYSIGSGCRVTTTVTINPAPPAIGGALQVCTGGSTTLTNSISGGSWNSSNPSIASVGLSSGLVTGGSAGIVTITYMAIGCRTAAGFTVNATPVVIGPSRVCTGSSLPFTTASGGGTWSSSAPGIASIGSSTGIVSGMATGTSTITYTLSGSCYGTRSITVSPNPSAITGPGSVCPGNTVTLTGSPGGGTWSRSNGNVVIGSLTGVVTGISSGTTVITYTLTTGCYMTRTVTVSTSAGSITGSGQVCAGATTLLTMTSGSGGTWGSSNTSIATVSSTGLVSGIATGTVNITYTLGSGCSVVHPLTVNGLPVIYPVTGGGNYCSGDAGLHIGLGGSSPGVTYQLFNGATGGAMLTGTGAALDFGLQTAAGIYTVKATNTAGCSRTMSGSATIGVIPLPVIIGPSALCVGATITLSSTPGGSWTSTVPAVAMIGASSGVVSGVATGTTVISYTSPTGCQSSTQVTVSTSPGAISGASDVCVGLSTTLTNTVPGGAWSSSSGVAMVGSLSGVVMGTAPGITTISYSLGTGCTVAKTMTVMASPLPVTGTGSLCVGGTAGLTSATPSGVWASSAGSIAGVSAGGLVSGVLAGTAIISYTVGSCSAILPVTVNVTPGAISGPAQVCIGSTITLTNPVAGGLWSATSPQVMIDGTAGTVNGISSGTALITYAIGSCLVTRTVSVNGVSAISGATGVCVGATTTLTSPGGGTWSSSMPGVATIGVTSGIVSGIAPGTTTITYTIGSTGCTATTTVTVNTAPGVITGTRSVCTGQTTTLNNGTGGGIWSSGSPLIASAGSLSGIITGNGPGTATITYSLGSGCTATAVVTVNTSPGAISGPTQTCVVSSITLSNPTPSGTWSTTGGTATITPGGVLSGTSAGTATVSYALSSGCAVTRNVTVNAAATAITGMANICVTQTTLLSNTMSGGTWSSGSTVIATVDASGMVTGVAPGMVAITYTLGSGCATTRMVTVNAAPAAITGRMQLCIGSTITLASSTPTGIWTSSGMGIATVSSTGVVSGIAIGTEDISYTVGGCPTVKTVTVNGLPPAVTGPGEVCVGSDILLSNATTGGTWSSSNPIIAPAGSATGIVSGINAGTATITYTLGAGCTVWKSVTVNPLPSGIRGSANICLGGSTTLSSPASGGVWSSRTPGIATIGSMSGVVNGLSGGLTIISYTLPATGCSATFGLTVIAVSPIEGITGLCAWGDTMLVHNSTTGGVFSSTLATVTNLGGGYGIVTGYATGTATITYTLVGPGCMTASPVTVNPLPGPITGVDRVCTGNTLLLGNTMAGGVWGSSDATVAPVTTGGSISGLVPGTTVVTYTLPTGCSVDTVITVSPPPSAIAGAAQICAGSTTTYTNTIAGGSWTSSAPLVAMIGVGTGLCSGLNAGVATISYTIAAGCRATKSITINALPTVYTVTGGGNYCAGGTGMSVGLSGSQSGTDYQLYHGTSAVGGAVTGTGMSVDFGLQTATGSYTARATNPVTGCTSAMSAGTVIGTVPTVEPSVTVSSSVGNTVCIGTPGTYTAIPVNSGSAPIYQWYVNGAPVGTGVSYSYTPGHGDVIQVELTSSAVCAIPPVVTGQVTMTVYNWFVPVVTITAQPGTTIKAGQWDTLVANVGGGVAAAYQWYLNGWPVLGANSNTYISNRLGDGDSVSCLVTGLCGGQSEGWVRIYHGSVGVTKVPKEGTIQVYPNPNGGSFTVKGRVVNPDQEVEIEVTNMLGQVVHNRFTRLKGDEINELVHLPYSIPNGMYLVTMRAGSEIKTFPFVVER